MVVKTQKSRHAWNEGTKARIRDQIKCTGDGTPRGLQAQQKHPAAASPINFRPQRVGCSKRQVPRQGHYWRLRRWRARNTGDSTGPGARHSVQTSVTAPGLLPACCKICRRNRQCQRPHPSSVSRMSFRGTEALARLATSPLRRRCSTSRL